MIVISGALVLVALVLLVIGLVSPDLPFVYASIGVSLASFAFLLVGILQRRKEDAAGATAEGAEGPQAAPAGDGPIKTGAAGLEGVGEAAVGTRAPSADAVPIAVVPSGSGRGKTGTVLVVAGRPRYHAAGCRYLVGKQAMTVDVVAAREEGFTACGVCRPDENLGASDTPALVDDPVVTQEAPVSGARTRRASAPARATAGRSASPVSKAPDAAKAASKAASKAPSKAPAQAVTTAATKAASKAPAKPAVKSAGKTAATAPAKAQAAAPAKRGGVIVIPDRGKFHAPDCRYVRGAQGTLELTKAQALRQGYEACGVCS